MYLLFLNFPIYNFFNSCIRYFLIQFMYLLFLYSCIYYFFIHVLIIFDHLFLFIISRHVFCYPFYDLMIFISQKN